MVRYGGFLPKIVSTFGTSLVILHIERAVRAERSLPTMKKFALSSLLLALTLLHQVHGAAGMQTGVGDTGNSFFDIALAKFSVPVDGGTIAVAVLLSCFIALQLARTRQLRRSSVDREHSASR